MRTVTSHNSLKLMKLQPHAYHRQGFTYDKLGNRLTLSEPRDDATTTYTYDNVTNELATILGGLYNVRMLVSSDSSYSPIQEQTFYDAYGRADISGSLQ